MNHETHEIHEKKYKASIDTAIRGVAEILVPAFSFVYFAFFVVEGYCE
jgi:hypothetical protein